MTRVFSVKLYLNKCILYLIILIENELIIGDLVPLVDAIITYDREIYF